MKKVLLSLALIASAHITTQAQAVIGTLSEDHLDVKTNDTYRARWTSGGHLLINTTGINWDGAGSPNTLGVRTSIAMKGDLVMESISTDPRGQIAMQSSMEITSSPHDYDGTLYNNGDRAYILLHDGHSKFNTDGNTYIQSYIDGHSALSTYSGTPRALGLNPEGGPVLINYTTPLSYDELQVEGSVNIKGIASNIDVFTANHNATNEDHTMIMDVSSGSISVTLPGNGFTVNNGKIYNIRRLDSNPSSTNTLTIYPASGETIEGASSFVIRQHGTTSGTQTPYQGIQIQKKGSTWYIINSYTY